MTKHSVYTSHPKWLIINRHLLQERINCLQKLLQEKESQLNEKERTIQILMKK